MRLDLKMAVRQLSRNPGFVLAAALTLALGIGANTAMFSVINALLLRPLPYPNPDRIVTLWEINPENNASQNLVSGPDFLDWKQQSKSFESMAVCPGWQGSTEFNLLMRDGTEKVQGTYASSGLFDVFGVKPLLGRPLGAEEDQREGSRGAVLSYALWRRSFSGDPGIIGKTLTIDTYGRRDYTIVGVMPADFGQPSRCEVWLPLGWMGVRLDERRSAHWHHVLARLKPGVSLEAARAELNTIQARLAAENPGTLIGSGVAAVPLLEQALGPGTKRALWILWAVVAVVLMIACANVASLTLVRAASRQKEIAVRLALGAGRARVIRQLLFESLIVAAIGGALGTLLAIWAIQLFVRLGPASLPRLAEIRIDGLALGFTLVVSTLSGILFGLAPARQFSKPDLNSALKSTGSSQRAVSRTRSFLVVAEVAMTMVLLIASGLLLQSFSRLLAAERGFQPEHLVTAQLDFSVSGFTTWIRPDPTRPQVPLREVIERLKHRPGVQVVGAASALPRNDRNPPNQTVTIFGRPATSAGDRPLADQKGITPDYLRALGVPLLRGRWFDENDTLQTKGVVLINKTFANRAFPNEDPIGKYITMVENPSSSVTETDRFGISIWTEVVGVVGDVKSLTPDPLPISEIYHPYWQWPMQSPVIALRTTGEIVAAIREDVKEIVPQLPPPLIRTMDEILSDTIAQPRFQALLTSIFSMAALLLAAVGIYGALAFAVSQRTRELGIRMALGARRASIISLVLKQGLKLTAIGVFVGLGISIGATRTLRSLLYGIEPTDPITFAGMALLLIAIALAACAIPSQRATKIQPIEALRCE